MDDAESDVEDNEESHFDNGQTYTTWKINLLSRQ